MSRRPRLLDAYCCAGGAARGYQRAGWHVTGIDINPQPRYAGDEFVQADALQYIADHGHKFDAIHASPPCQAYSNAQRLRGRAHPDLVAPTRDLLNASGRPWVIENVEGAPLRNPIMLCGSMFPGLGTYRHRLFESSILLMQLAHPEHTAPVRKMGRPPQPGEFMHVVGNFSGVDQARRAMGIDWMVRDELREAIPPAYTEHIGRALLEYLAAERAA